MDVYVPPPPPGCPEKVNLDYYKIHVEETRERVRTFTNVGEAMAYCDMISVRSLIAPKQRSSVAKKMIISGNLKLESDYEKTSSFSSSRSNFTDRPYVCSQSTVERKVDATQREQSVIEDVPLARISEQNIESCIDLQFSKESNTVNSSNEPAARCPSISKNIRREAYDRNNAAVINNNPLESFQDRDEKIDEKSTSDSNCSPSACLSAQVDYTSNMTEIFPMASNVSTSSPENCGPLPSLHGDEGMAIGVDTTKFDLNCHLNKASIESFRIRDEKIDEKSTSDSNCSPSACLGAKVDYTSNMTETFPMASSVSTSSTAKCAPLPSLHDEEERANLKENQGAGEELKSCIIGVASENGVYTPKFDLNCHLNKASIESFRIRDEKIDEKSTSDSNCSPSACLGTKGDYTSNMTETIPVASSVSTSSTEKCAPLPSLYDEEERAKLKENQGTVEDLNSCIIGVASENEVNTPKFDLNCHLNKASLESFRIRDERIDEKSTSDYNCLPSACLVAQVKYTSTMTETFPMASNVSTSSTEKCAQLPSLYDEEGKAKLKENQGVGEELNSGIVEVPCENGVHTPSFDLNCHLNKAFKASSVEDPSTQGEPLVNEGILQLNVSQIVYQEQLQPFIVSNITSDAQNNSGEVVHEKAGSEPFVTNECKLNVVVEQLYCVPKDFDTDCNRSSQEENVRIRSPLAENDLESQKDGEETLSLDNYGDSNGELKSEDQHNDSDSISKKERQEGGIECQYNLNFCESNRDGKENENEFTDEEDFDLNQVLKESAVGSDLIKDLYESNRDFQDTKSDGPGGNVNKSDEIGNESSFNNCQANIDGQETDSKDKNPSELKLRSNKDLVESPSDDNGREVNTVEETVTIVNSLHKSDCEYQVEINSLNEQLQGSLFGTNRLAMRKDNVSESYKEAMERPLSDTDSVSTSERQETENESCDDSCSELNSDGKDLRVESLLNDRDQLKDRTKCSLNDNAGNGQKPGAEYSRNDINSCPDKSLKHLEDEANILSTPKIVDGGCIIYEEITDKIITNNISDNQIESETLNYDNEALISFNIDAILNRDSGISSIPPSTTFSTETEQCSIGTESSGKDTGQINGNFVQNSDSMDHSEIGLPENFSITLANIKKELQESEFENEPSLKISTVTSLNDNPAFECSDLDMYLDEIPGGEEVTAIQIPTVKTEPLDLPSEIDCQDENSSTISNNDDGIDIVDSGTPETPSASTISEIQHFEVEDSETPRPVISRRKKQNYTKEIGFAYVWSEGRLLRLTGSRGKTRYRNVGVAIYPGPLHPLHLGIQCHLYKLRRTRTDIDKHWATFAAAATMPLDVRKRFIIPVKTKVSIPDKISNKVPSMKSKSKIDREIFLEFKLKNCHIILDRMKLPLLSIWCMHHNVYSCNACQLGKETQRFRPPPPGSSIEIASIPAVLKPPIENLPIAAASSPTPHNISSSGLNTIKPISKSSVLKHYSVFVEPPPLSNDLLRASKSRFGSVASVEQVEISIKKIKKDVFEVGAVQIISNYRLSRGYYNRSIEFRVSSNGRIFFGLPGSLWPPKKCEKFDLPMVLRRLYCMKKTFFYIYKWENMWELWRAVDLPKKSSHKYAIVINLNLDPLKLSILLPFGRWFIVPIRQKIDKIVFKREDIEWTIKPPFVSRRYHDNLRNPGSLNINPNFGIEVSRDQRKFALFGPYKENDEHGISIYNNGKELNMYSGIADPRSNLDSYNADVILGSSIQQAVNLVDGTMNISAIWVYFRKNGPSLLRVCGSKLGMDRSSSESSLCFVKCNINGIGCMSLINEFGMRWIRDPLDKKEIHRIDNVESLTQYLKSKIIFIPESTPIRWYGVKRGCPNFYPLLPDLFGGRTVVVNGQLFHLTAMSKELWLSFKSTLKVFLPDRGLSFLDKYIEGPHPIGCDNLKKLMAKLIKIQQHCKIEFESSARREKKLTPNKSSENIPTDELFKDVTSKNAVFLEPPSANVLTTPKSSMENAYLNPFSNTLETEVVSGAQKVQVQSKYFDHTVISDGTDTLTKSLLPSDRLIDDSCSVEDVDDDIMIVEVITEGTLTQETPIENAYVVPPCKKPILLKQTKAASPELFQVEKVHDHKLTSDGQQTSVESTENLCLPRHALAFGDPCAVEKISNESMTPVTYTDVEYLEPPSKMLKLVPVNQSSPETNVDGNNGSKGYASYSKPNNSMFINVIDSISGKPKKVQVEFLSKVVKINEATNLYKENSVESCNTGNIVLGEKGKSPPSKLQRIMPAVQKWVLNESSKMVKGSIQKVIVAPSPGTISGEKGKLPQGRFVPVQRSLTLMPRVIGQPRTLPPMKTIGTHFTPVKTRGGPCNLNRGLRVILPQKRKVLATQIKPKPNIVSIGDSNPNKVNVIDPSFKKCSMFQAPKTDKSPTNASRLELTPQKISYEPKPSVSPKSIEIVSLEHSYTGHNVTDGAESPTVSKRSIGYENENKKIKRKKTAIDVQCYESFSGFEQNDVEASVDSTKSIRNVVNETSLKIVKSKTLKELHVNECDRPHTPGAQPGKVISNILVDSCLRETQPETQNRKTFIDCSPKEPLLKTPFPSPDKCSTNSDIDVTPTVPVGKIAINHFNVYKRISKFFDTLDEKSKKPMVQGNTAVNVIEEIGKTSDHKYTDQESFLKENTSKSLTDCSIVAEDVSGSLLSESPVISDSVSDSNLIPPGQEQSPPSCKRRVTASIDLNLQSKIKYFDSNNLLFLNDKTQHHLEHYGLAFNPVEDQVHKMAPYAVEITEEIGKTSEHKYTDRESLKENTSKSISDCSIVPEDVTGSLLIESPAISGELQGSYLIKLGQEQIRPSCKRRVTESLDLNHHLNKIKFFDSKKLPLLEDKTQLPLEQHEMASNTVEDKQLKMASNPVEDIKLLHNPEDLQSASDFIEMISNLISYSNPPVPLPFPEKTQHEEIKNLPNPDDVINRHQLRSSEMLSDSLEDSFSRDSQINQLQNRQSEILSKPVDDKGISEVNQQHSSFSRDSQVIQLQNRQSEILPKPVDDKGISEVNQQHIGKHKLPSGPENTITTFASNPLPPLRKKRVKYTPLREKPLQCHSYLELPIKPNSLPLNPPECINAEQTECIEAANR